MNISELVKQAHDNAVNKGFYECPECTGTGNFEICLLVYFENVGWTEVVQYGDGIYYIRDKISCVTDARKEAERRAVKNQNTEQLVLKVVGECIGEVTVKWGVRSGK